MFARHQATPQTPQPLPRLARAADLLAAILFLIGTIAMFTPGIVIEFGPLHLSMRSTWRLYLWTAVLLGIRHWFVPEPASLAWLIGKAGTPLPFEERRLFGEELTWGQRLGRFALIVAGFSIVSVAVTWPQILHPYSVPDLGDPLFSIWRMAWVNHQIVRDPLRLFDANMFYPEPLTLTYSDSIIVPALMSAPLFWMGVHPVLIYNVLFLAAFVASGATTFLLVRAITGRADAAIVAGTIFTSYSYRFEHYPHLELQMTMWMPLTLWAVHRTMAAGRLRDGLAAGLTFALQLLSSLYYGLFLAVYLVPVAGSLWLARGRPSRPLRMLASGVALAAVLASPVIYAYTANKGIVGERPAPEVEFYSAQGADYLEPHFRTLVYGKWSDGGQPERQLFPRVMPVALAATALWPPLSAVRIAYTLALVTALDGSFGLKGQYYPLLYSYVMPYRGLRVPARFSIVVGLTLAVLAGLGVARIAERWPRYRAVLVSLSLALTILEAAPRIELEPVWREPPPVYASLADEPSAVLAEFPIPTIPVEYFQDTRYLYFSTFHWHPLLNGNSGYFPKSYEELIERARDFPSDASVEYLKRRRVDYVTVHGAFMERGKFQATVTSLDARRDMQLVAAAPWEGSESRLYKLTR